MEIMIIIIIYAYLFFNFQIQNSLGRSLFQLLFTNKPFLFCIPNILKILKLFPNPQIPLLLFLLIHHMLSFIIILLFYFLIVFQCFIEHVPHILIIYCLLRFMYPSHEFQSTQVPNEQMPMLMIQQLFMLASLSNPGFRKHLDVYRQFRFNVIRQLVFNVPVNMSVVRQMGFYFSFEFLPRQTRDSQKSTKVDRQDAIVVTSLVILIEIVTLIYLIQFRLFDNTGCTLEVKRRLFCNLHQLIIECYNLLMHFIYQRVVESLKKDSIQRYEERKRNYRIKNGLDHEEQQIQIKKTTNSNSNRQRFFQNNVQIDERPLKPKQQTSYQQQLKQTIKLAIKTQNVQTSQPLPVSSITVDSNPFIKAQIKQQQVIRPIHPLQKQTFDQKQVQEVKLVMCPQGCERQFAPKVLQKHIKICKKVFQTKRDPVDLQQKRTNELQKVATKKTSQPAPKKSNFKAESLYFQAVMRQQKGEELTEQQRAMMKAHEDSKLEECKNCKKRIAPNRMESHLKACMKIRK